MNKIQIMLDQQEELIKVQKGIMDMQDQAIELLKAKCANLEEIVALCDKKVDAIAEALKTKGMFLDTPDEEMAYREALNDFRTLYFQKGEL